MTTYYMEAMVCQSYGGDSGDWWTVGDQVKVPDGRDVSAAFSAYVERVEREQENADGNTGFVVGVFPYACTESDEDENDED